MSNFDDDNFDQVIETEEDDPDEVIEPEEEEDEEKGEEEEIPKCEPCEGQRIEIQRVMNNEKWEYYWLLYAKNGKELATNPKPFKRLNDMKKAIKAVGELVPTAPIVRLY